MFIFFKYIFHYNCNLVITTSQISHYNFTNLLCGSINRRICGLDFCYTSCDECVAKVIFTCRCGGREGGWSEGAELSERRGASLGQSHTSHSHSLSLIFSPTALRTTTMGDCVGSIIVLLLIIRSQIKLNNYFSNLILFSRVPRFIVY